MTADLKTRALVAAENCESEGWDESGRAVRDLVDRLTVAEEYVVHRNRQIDEQNARLAAAERVLREIAEWSGPGDWTDVLKRMAREALPQDSEKAYLSKGDGQMGTPTTTYTVEEFDATPKAHECPTCGRTHLGERPNETSDLNFSQQPKEGE